MLTEPLTLASIGAALGIAYKVGGTLIDYLTLKIGPRPAGPAARQSADCHLDHERISNLIAAQNANIARMLEQNGEQIKALTDANHSSQLRHQIVLAKLDRIETRLDIQPHRA